MTESNHIQREDIRRRLEECVRCGRCLSVCPVYKLTGWEGSAARGKIALLKADLAGTDGLDRRMKDLLSHCLGCGACAETCVTGVQGDELIQSGRRLAMSGRGLQGLRNLIGRDLLSRGPLARGLWAGRKLFLKNVDPDSGLHFRFPAPGLGDRWLPPVTDRPFLGRSHPRPGPRTGRPRVALFAGCVANWFRPETAESAIRVLEAAGVEVVVPAGQVCCGKPAAGAGAADAARHVAQKNIEAFSGVDFDHLVTFCATCSHQLKEYDRMDLEGGAGVAGRVKDFAQFLVDDLGWTPPAGPTGAPARPLKVFYHDPCHLRRKQGVAEPPRRLLAGLSEIELVGAEAPPVCCGYGGVFNLWHYDLSRRQFETRVQSVAPHAPDLVATTCSGCWLQFEDQSRALGRPFGVRPLPELLAERLSTSINP
jgi:glycolate oxidase iron-sulfur subunit